jgi:hypothetical protein
VRPTKALVPHHEVGVLLSTGLATSSTGSGGGTGERTRHDLGHRSGGGRLTQAEAHALVVSAEGEPSEAGFFHAGSSA